MKVRVVGLSIAMLAAVVLVAPQVAGQPARSVDQSGLPAGNARFVEAAFAGVVHRPSSDAEQARWTPALDAGGPRADLAWHLALSPERSRIVVAGLYLQLLGRPSDPGGLSHWSAHLSNGGSVAEVATSLLGSGERYRSAGSTASGYVQALYQALLGRDGDAAGALYWAGLLRSGAPRSTVAGSLFGSVEATGLRVDSIYLELVGRHPDAAGRSYWAQRLTSADDRILVVALVASSEFFRASQVSDGSTTTTSTTTTTTTTTLTTTTTIPVPPPPEHFTGTVDDFYVVPEPLAAANPGVLIRYQDVADSGGQVTLRVMYHSRDAEGRDAAVTGLVTYPKAAAPPAGWPVVSMAHGTTGVSSQCAPSRWTSSSPSFGLDAVSVSTDYLGLGPVGQVHPYLSGISEGNAMLDIIRAVRSIPEANAGNRWFSIGGSQGGHAALFGAERSATYAPELDLIGTVALVPPAAFDQTFGPVDEIVVRVIGVMMLFGASQEHPNLRFEDYAGPQVAAAVGTLEDGCLGEITPEFALMPADGFWKVDPRTVEPTKSWVEAQEPGTVATDAPMYIASGTADIQVNFHRERILVDRLCGLGQVVEFHEIAGADHGGVGVITASAVEQWLADRLAGAPAPDSCDDPDRPLPIP